MSGPQIDWKSVERVLVVKLRSIGDTVLSTPSLIALRRFLPDAQIDVLLEDWVAPVLEGFDEVNSVLGLEPGQLPRAQMMRRINREKYDIAFNLHGGTTSTFFIAASRARHRIGYRDYQYSFLYNHLFSSSAEFWGREKTHSAEQQLALVGYAGVPVDDRPRSRLAVTAERAAEVDALLAARGLNEEKNVLIHPAAVFETKRWSGVNYAALIDHLVSMDLDPIIVSAANEDRIIEEIRQSARADFNSFVGLALPEVTALAARSRLFVGNDSGIAHIAAAVGTPSVVIFGSSNRDHWRPWTDAPNEIVFQEFDCQPCPGYVCEKFGEPRCILSIRPSSVIAAVNRLLGD